MSTAETFLTQQMAYAQTQLDRLHRVEDELRKQLKAEGLSDLQAAEKLAVSKTYNQLRRDEKQFFQIWSSAHNQLLKLEDRAITAHYRKLNEKLVNIARQHTPPPAPPPQPQAASPTHSRSA